MQIFRVLTGPTTPTYMSPSVLLLISWYNPRFSINLPPYGTKKYVLAFSNLYDKKIDSVTKTLVNKFAEATAEEKFEGDVTASSIKENSSKYTAIVKENIEKLVMYTRKDKLLTSPQYNSTRDKCFKYIIKIFL